MMSASLFIFVAIFIIIGCFSGLIAGLYGVGGAIIVIPGLVFIFQRTQLIPADMTMHFAAGSSLAIMILTSLASLRTHLRFGAILWLEVRKLLPGLALGSICGGLLAGVISTVLLKKIYAIFLILLAIKLFKDIHIIHPARSPKKLINWFISFGIGIQSGLMGIGSGALVVPYLTYCGLNLSSIFAISNLSTLTVAIIGSLVYMFTGQQEANTVAYSTGYVYWPAVLMVAIPSTLFAPIGVKLQYVLPPKPLKLIFILIMVSASLSMLF